MYLHKYYAVIFAMCCMQLCEIRAYSTQNLRRLFGPALNARYTGRDILIPQTDEDVLELEHLKRHHDVAFELPAEMLPPPEQSNHAPLAAAAQPDTATVTDADLAAAEAINQSATLPELERQLESAAAAAAAAAQPSATPAHVDNVTGQTEHAEDIGGGVQGAHRPPMLPHNDGGKNSQQQQPEAATDGNNGVPSMAKPFYGAARLAFGQNPEVLPTTTTTTTTSTTTVTAKTTTAEESILTADVPQTIEPTINATLKSPVAPPIAVHPQPPLDAELPVQEQLNKESVGDVVVEELEATRKANRRSIGSSGPILMTPKTAESLLRHRDGQYSSFDMAQYVFWTGDEVGVARAVEEFIEQGLMTRENALKFLRDIRLGIEYLQRSYSNRVFPEEIRENHIKKSFATPPIATTSTTSTTTTTTTTEKPFPRVHIEDEAAVVDDDVVEPPHNNNRHFQRAIDSIALWNKLQAMNNEDRQELGEYDEAAGRAKIAEFLYKEYSLEEILYNLAKVMFTQSLAHGSDEAQQELQKLTDFLEREGNRGIIPLDLQKKVLHVLLTALSDTLRERPELLPAARLNLGSSLNSLPMRTFGTFK